MIRKLTKNEKSCNPNCDYKIVIPNGESYLTQKQFDELAREVKNLDLHVVSNNEAFKCKTCNDTKIKPNGNYCDECEEVSEVAVCRNCGKPKSEHGKASLMCPDRFKHFEAN